MTEYELAMEALRSTPSFQSSILQSPKRIPYYYQYRTFGSFWSIIKSDSFWATDARFSNDSEEQRFGANIMHRLSPVGQDVSMELNEDYIVCFCGEDDKLSQWRGYTAEGGVSVGFDFNAAVPFHVLLKEQEFKANLPPSAYQKLFVQLKQVCYLPSQREDEEDEHYKSACARQIGCPDDVQDNAHDAAEKALEELKKCAPFIKHAGFREEDEYRLVFRNEDGHLTKCVRYHDVEGSGIRRPYIVVKPGDPAFDGKLCTVRLCLKEAGLTRRLTEELKGKLARGVKLIDCHVPPDGKLHKGYTDRLCFGCTRRYWVNDSSVTGVCRYAQSKSEEFEYGPHAAENSVIISQGKQQERVFNAVYKAVKKIDPSIPVWCEGHLPIRSITVGPCTHQREAEENIRHYCRHVYWLRDVEIKSSTIPFRRAM